MIFVDMFSYSLWIFVGYWGTSWIYVFDHETTWISIFDMWLDDYSCTMRI